MLSTIRPELRPKRETGRLDALNAVPVSFARFEAALGVLARLDERVRSDPAMRRSALGSDLRGTDRSGDVALDDALEARIAALDKWTAAHDPARQSNADAVITAAARFPLSRLADGIGFEPAAFQEMVLFIEELPW